VGKTALAERLLKGLRGWGAIKFTRTAFYCSVSQQEEGAAPPDKDTQRLLRAGAQEVLWVQSPPGQPLREALEVALQRLGSLQGILIEGNSAVELLNPDIVVFIYRAGPLKDSAQRVLRMAHVLVAEPGQALREAGKEVFYSTEDCARYILRRIVRQEVRELLLREAQGGRISCAQARAIAQRLGVPYLEVGRAADELGIKITDCELGCF